MKVLITGATGFLGKKVLELLNQDDRVTAITVITRKKLFHPSKKVGMQVLDLADPLSVSLLSSLTKECDSIVHLAGLYNFESEYQHNFLNNVLPATHLVQALQRAFPEITGAPPVYFASTFAVGLGTGEPLLEESLRSLSPRQYSYSHTKGMAERILSDSPFRTYSFRLGALTGAPSDDGFIEKIDGPYTFFKILRRVARLPGAQFLRFVPIPADPKGMIPVLPADTAAKIFADALFNDELNQLTKAHLGVCNEHSANIKEICDMAVKQFLPDARPIYISKMPKSFQLLERVLLKGAAEIFEFSMKPVVVQNETFKKLFPKISIPHLRDYQYQFIKGFEHFCEDKHP